MPICEKCNHEFATYYWLQEHHRLGECTAKQLNTARQRISELEGRLQEAEGLLREVERKSINEEWPDCGKPYWYCELCGEGSKKGQDATFIVHDDCPIPEIKAFLTMPGSKNNEIR